MSPITAAIASRLLINYSSNKATVKFKCSKAEANVKSELNETKHNRRNTCSRTISGSSNLFQPASIGRGD